MITRSEPDSDIPLTSQELAELFVRVFEPIPPEPMEVDACDLYSF